MATRAITLICAMGLQLLLGCSVDEFERGSVQQAVIECNGSTVGLGCDTDDDPCTQEVCVQQGQNVLCILDQLAPDGTPCLSDSQACTADTCQSGSCAHTPLPVDTLCDDGLFCTSGDSCDASGVCGGGGQQCKDDNPCTVESCDEVADVCEVLITVAASCDDENACTNATTCDAQGTCNGGENVVCDDGSQCTGTTCDPDLGCTFPILEVSPCNDTFFCTIGETCTVDGNCEGAANCLDSNQCTADACDELAGSCSNTPLDGAMCNDDNECTENDSCSGASCSGTPVANGTPCGTAGGCLAGGTCANGSCVGGATQPENTPCDDNNACTTNDVCTLGECGGYPLNCFDGDACTADGCDEVTGCFNPNIEGCTLEDPDAGPADAGPGPTDAGLTDAAVEAADADEGQDAGPQGVLGGGGCSSSGGGSGMSALFLLLLMASLGRKRGSRAGVLLVLALPLLALPLLARSARAEGFDSEIFKPGTSSTSFFSQEGARVLEPWTFNLGLSVNVSSDPLVLRDAETGEPLMDGVLVSQRRGAYLAGGLGLPLGLELGLALPVVLSQDGDGSNLDGGRDLSSTSLGDLRADLKARLYRHSKVSLTGAVSMSLPAGDDDALFGETGLTASPRFVVGLQLGRVQLGANLGLRLREKTEVGGLSVSNELIAGLGGSVELLEEDLWLIGEAYASRALRDGSAESSPAEALIGARYAVSGPYQLQAAGGVGIGRGYGTPSNRVLLGLLYVPRVEATVPLPEPIVVKVQPEPEPEPEPVDSDGDGIVDPEDQCPQQAEDMDGFEDQNGCPDLDNDGDTIADTDDACPLQAEVVNGINDTDGCPDEGIIIMIEDRVVLEETVLFDKNRARVKHKGRKALKAIVTLYQQHPEWDRMRVEGHADSRGPSDFNMSLSRRRAERVEQEMIKLGMAPAKIMHQAFGETKPLVEGDSDEVMKKNRRVEFVILNFRKEVQEKITVPIDGSAPSALPAKPQPTPSEPPAPQEPAPRP